MVKEDTGSVEMGLVNIDRTWTLKLVPAVAPLGIVKLIRDKVELVVEPQLTVTNTIVPAAQEVLLIADKFAVIASGIPTRITPLDGMLFSGVNVIINFLRDFELSVRGYWRPLATQWPVRLGMWPRCPFQENNVRQN
jgi:hypothetical protein